MRMVAGGLRLCTSQVPPALAIRQPDAPVRHTGHPDAATQVSRPAEGEVSAETRLRTCSANILGQVGRPPLRFLRRASTWANYPRRRGRSCRSRRRTAGAASRPPATPNRRPAIDAIERSESDPVDEQHRKWWRCSAAAPPAAGARSRVRLPGLSGHEIRQVVELFWVFSPRSTSVLSCSFAAAVTGPFRAPVEILVCGTQASLCRLGDDGRGERPAA